MKLGVGCKFCFSLPKGAVIGPLVVCGAVFDESDLPKLKELGVKDSKLLSPPQRERLRAGIEKLAKAIIIEKLQSWDIDISRGSGTDLNRLETLKFVSIVNRAFESLRVGKVVIDAPDPNLPKFRLMLASLIRRDSLEMVVEHHADLNHIECSAASIIAKTERDSDIENLKTKYGDFGAGYPSDPKCVEWLKNQLELGKLPDIVRHSWDTVAVLKDRKLQKSLEKFFGTG
ncbi:MAG: ribonuclease HII [Candidatus Aenigmarchaeota archaeon]|nr:ribonuclease HII [Candidatus Aenigmarchaeota archaeon]